MSQMDENLDREETRKFIGNAFRNGFLQESGTVIAKVLPPVSRFTTSGKRTKKRETVLEKLSAFFNRFKPIFAPPRQNYRLRRTRRTR